MNLASSGYLHVYRRGLVCFLHFTAMMRQIMALFDEYQSKENAKHVLRAMNENARQGFWNGAPPPIGYRIVAAEQRGSKTKKKLEIDPLHADTVRLIYRLFLEDDGNSGPLGVKAITCHLNERRGGAMTLRTGRGSAGGTYRYYTCSTKARQGKTGCEGRIFPMDKLDDLIASHLEERLLRPDRLKTILANLLDRREERTERRREHLAELNRRITETDQRLNRLYDAIEAGLAMDCGLRAAAIGGITYALWRSA
ncbi:recombinase zinc beta ribbon domain-containing protein [Bradyrhizobium monzae]|uniref:recombinase zinc beta ribbon domain-containing protein n=1 Tax=Bradyrhizobium sp. Oc8 TaxID=2876780 RepID=UPI001F21F62E|nr:recombinase zinc beta ribbon domain-containing protein [Bradyrhizobium sp. Oc8]